LNAIGFKVVEKQNELGEKRNSWRMNFTDNDFGFYFAKSEFRWNYSFQKRHKEWKETEGNSSDYIALQVKYFSGISSSSPYYSRNSGPNEAIFYSFQWGMQRQLGYNFVFNFFFGYGSLRDLRTNKGVVIPSFGFKLNYHLIKL